MPFNVRPLLGVRKKQNPKGLALFGRALFNMFRLTDDETYLGRGQKLLNRLLENSRGDDFSGHCWGYDHPWQNIAFFIPPYEPNAVVTCSVADTFLSAYKITGNVQFLDICESIADFLMHDLTQINVGPGLLCCSYDLHSNWKVINVNSFVAAFLAKLYKITGKEKYRDHAQPMMRWVLSQKTDYHAWYYTDPPEKSRITHDNYHTGFVLDAIAEYLHVFPDAQIEQDYLNGLKFYRENLFTDDYAPKWMYDRNFPHDIHGAAQGIITFSRAAARNSDHLTFAQNILDWTLRNLYESKSSRFYYQKGKIWTKRYTLMRWCQAWMCYAISAFLLIEKSSKKITSNR
ncbi:MAG: hypothetical protein JXD22_15855 [Sedimentisphaerales bacterium]|nr:hypothetical protein [Sedimentisphaerales bacterium]